MGAFINYVDVFLDLFVPLFPLYRIEVALINKIAHGAVCSRKIAGKQIVKNNIAVELGILTKLDPSLTYHHDSCMMSNLDKQVLRLAKSYTMRSL